MKCTFLWTKPSLHTGYICHSYMPSLLLGNSWVVLPPSFLFGGQLSVLTTTGLTRSEKIYS